MAIKLEHPKTLGDLEDYCANKTLWTDLDASKEYGFGVVNFHVKTDAENAENDKELGEKCAKWPARHYTELVMSLSRVSTSTEKNSGPLK